MVLLLLVISLACTQQPGSMDDESQNDEVSEDAAPFEEVDGTVAVEAEHYHAKLTNGTPRDWHVISNEQDEVADQTTDHSATASGGAYIEGLPDTRITHDDSLIIGTNIFSTAGEGAILQYKVWFNTPGRYTVWVRAYSTGSEDNGIHAGIDDSWPEMGARMQWCEGKDQWTWSSAQRVPENHCGIPRTIHLEVEDIGLHVIQFAMREDGFEFDKWMMTLDEQSVPEGNGPGERRRP